MSKSFGLPWAHGCCCRYSRKSRLYLLDLESMQVSKTKSSESEVTFTVIPNQKELSDLKEHVLGHFHDRVKVPGFRAGKVPLNVLEKHIDSNQLQSEFLQDAIEQMYPQAIMELNVRPLSQPQISVKKFVPFNELEFEATVAVLGEVKLHDYKKIKRTLPKAQITTKDINDVLNSLRTRIAEKKDVSRPAKKGDQVWIDFEGRDSKGNPIKGADGKDYPLLLGSNTFIPGFEDNLIGLSGGQEKTFTLTFPKDYGIKAIAGKKVTFKAAVTKVQEVVEPELNDEFAAKAGPFKTLKDLKSDIKKQLEHEQNHKIRQDFESELIREISAKSQLNIPEIMVSDQAEKMLQEVKQNLAYRGQTFQEMLEIEGKTEEEYVSDSLKPQAEERVRASLVLSEIAELEKIEVTPEELEVRMQLLKGQYQDPQMQAELDKPEARQEIASRLITEKTLQKLTSYAAK